MRDRHEHLGEKAGYLPIQDYHDSRLKLAGSYPYPHFLSPVGPVAGTFDCRVLLWADSAAGLGPARTRVAVNVGLNLNTASNKQGAAAAQQPPQYPYSGYHGRSLSGTTGRQAQSEQV